MKKITTEKFLICLVAAMSLLCVSLAPSSKVKDIVKILHELSLTDGQAISDAKKEVINAQDAESKGKNTKAARAYAKAARSLIEALKNNRIKCSEAQRNYRAIEAEISIKKATSTELRPIFMRMLKLDGEYQQLHALLEDIDKKLPKGRVKMPAALTDFTGLDALRVEIDRIGVKVAAKRDSGNEGLAKLRGEKEKMVARYQGLTEVLDGHKADVEEFELIVSTDNGKTVYSIRLKEKIIRAQKVLSALEKRVSQIDAKIAELSAPKTKNLKIIGDIRDLPKNLSSLIMLRRKAENIRKLAANGDLHALIEALKKDKAHQSLLEYIDESRETISSKLRDHFIKADKYSGTMANIENDKNEMDERSIISELESGISRLAGELKRSNKRSGDISGEIYRLLNESRPDVDTLISLYGELTAERSKLRRIVSDILILSRQETRIEGVDRTTRREIAYLKDLMRERSYMRRSVRVSEEKARSVAKEWDERMSRIVKEAIGESVKDTDYGSGLNGDIADPGRTPVGIEDHLDSYNEILQEVNTFLEKVPVMTTKIAMIKKEYDGIDGKVEAVNELLKEVDGSIVAVQTTSLLRGKSRKFLERRAKIQKRLDELQRNRVGNLNDQLTKVVEDPDSEVSLMQAYNDLETEIYDLWDSAAFPLNKWKPLKSVFTDVEDKLSALKKNIAVVKRLMNIPIIKSKALKEEPRIQDVLAGTFLNDIFADWTVFLNWIRPQLMDDKRTGLDPEWTARSRQIEKDMDGKLAFIDGLTGRYKPMEGLLGEVLSVERKDVRGRSTTKDLKVKELIGQSEAVGKKVRSGRNALYTLRDSLEAIQAPNADIASEKKSLAARIRKVLAKQEAANNSAQPKKDQLWEIVRPSPEMPLRDRQEYKEHVLFSFVDHLSNMQDLMRERETLTVDVVKLEKKALRAAEEAATMSQVSVAKTETESEKKFEPEALAAKLTPKIHEITALMGKYGITRKKTDNFAKDKDNYDEVILRLEAKGNELLLLDAGEIGVLKTAVEAIRTENVNKKKLKMMTGLKGVEPKALIYVLHRLLSPPQIVDLYVSDVDEADEESLRKETLDRISRIADSEAAVYKKPVDIKLVGLPLDIFVGSESAANVTFFKAKPGEGLTHDTGKAPQKIKMKEIFEDVFKKRLERGNMRPFVKAEINKLNILINNQIDGMYLLENNIEKSISTRKKLDEKIIDGKFTDEYLDEGDYLDRYVMPFLSRWKPVSDSLWQDISREEIINRMFAEYVRTSAYGALEGGDIKKALELFKHYYLLSVEKIIVPKIQRIKERIDRARIEDPNTVFVFIVNEVDRPVIDKIWRGKELPEDFRTLRYKYLANKVSERIFARKSGKGLDDPIIYGRILLSSFIEYRLNKVGDIPMEEAELITERIIQQLNMDDMRTIGNMYKKRGWDKDTHTLFIKLMLREPSLMDANIRRLLMPSAFFYHAELFNATRTTFAKMMEVMGHGESDAHILNALRVMLMADFMTGLTDSERKLFFEVEDMDPDSSGEFITFNINGDRTAQERAEYAFRRAKEDFSYDQLMKFNVDLFQKAVGKIDERYKKPEKPGDEGWISVKALECMVLWAMGQHMDEKEFKDFIVKTAGITGRGPDIFTNEFINEEQGLALKNMTYDEIILRLDDLTVMNKVMLKLLWERFRNGEQEIFDTIFSSENVLRLWTEVEKATDEWILSKDRPSWKELVGEPAAEVQEKASDSLNETVSTGILSTTSL
ncbi:hypothetical protein ACFLQ8_01415 [Candidatus Auribacterota bacterium]